MQKYTVLKHKVLYVDEAEAYSFYQGGIYVSRDSGHSWALVSSLPIPTIVRVVMKSSLLSRLFRLGAHHLLILPESMMLFLNRNILKSIGRNHWQVDKINGSKPLVICEYQGAVYYGEYKSNQNREPIRVLKNNIETMLWDEVWCFHDIRHIHGIFHDPYTDSMWVTTGDSDKESGIWVTEDNFRTLTKVLGGSQQFRAVQLLFTKKKIYFASDAPNEINYIYEFDRNSTRVKKLLKLKNPVFFGCRVGEYMFFSTSVEPSEINTYQKTEVYYSQDGQKWSVLAEFDKDSLSKKYFQYGYVTFPIGPGDGKHLFFTPHGTTYHGRTIRISLKDVN